VGEFGASDKRIDAIKGFCVIKKRQHGDIIGVSFFANIFDNIDE